MPFDIGMHPTPTKNLGKKVIICSLLWGVSHGCLGLGMHSWPWRFYPGYVHFSQDFSTPSPPPYPTYHSSVPVRSRRKGISTIQLDLALNMSVGYE